jgi:hypothetical protein
MSSQSPSVSQSTKDLDMPFNRRIRMMHVCLAYASVALKDVTSNIYSIVRQCASSLLFPAALGTRGGGCCSRAGDMSLRDVIDHQVELVRTSAE